MLVPVVGDDDEGAITVEVDRGVVTYHENTYPLAPGSTTLEEQHYRLVSWRDADSHLNYRRFFAVNTLAAIMVEDADVFPPRTPRSGAGSLPRTVGEPRRRPARRPPRRPLRPPGATSRTSPG